VGRILSERERSSERTCKKTMAREWSEEREGHGVRSGRVTEREQSSEQTKLATQHE